MSSERLSFAPCCVHAATVDINLNRAQRLISSQRLQPAEQQGIFNVSFNWSAENYHRLLSPQTFFADEDPHAAACRAIALGLWDWQRKTYTSGYALSLSGGADSALCGTMVWFAQVQAALTLGEEEYRHILSQGRIQVIPRAEKSLLDWIRQDVMPNVLTTVYQGSAHSGSVTRNAASGLALAMGAQHHDWSIAELVTGYLKLVNDLTPDNPMTWERDDLALQNIQARVRSPGIWLIANRQNKLLMATSNLVITSYSIHYTKLYDSGIHPFINSSFEYLIIPCAGSATFILSESASITTTKCLWRQCAIQGSGNLSAKLL